MDDPLAMWLNGLWKHKATASFCIWWYKDMVPNLA